jgi:hypothetical protein
MDCIDFIFAEKPCGCNKIQENKRIFSDLMEKTRQCMANNPDDDPIECETAYLSANNEFTFHTHPQGTREPSEIDRNTTKRLNKDLLCIGLVPTGETVCWSKEDGFKNEVCSF